MNLEMFWGDTGVFTHSVTVAGVQKDLTGCSLAMYASPIAPVLPGSIAQSSIGGSAPIVFTNITGAGTAPQATLTMQPATTMAFPNQDTQFQVQWRLTDAIGYVTTTETCTLLVKRRVPA